MRRSSRRSRFVAVLALALIALLGMELAEASCHTHSAAANCAPCRVLSLCTGADLPAPLPALAPPVAYVAAIHDDDTPALSRALPTAEGRGPPALL